MELYYSDTRWLLSKKAIRIFKMKMRIAFLIFKESEAYKSSALLFA